VVGVDDSDDRRVTRFVSRCRFRARCRMHLVDVAMS
jgi:hypothetical protein